MSSPDNRDPTRRTWLAAERTWLAWWRSGVTAAATAVAVGRLVPELVGGSRTPYMLLGAGYAVVAVGVFVAGARRHQQVSVALKGGGYAGVDAAWVGALTAAAVLLAVGTLAVIIA